MIRIILKSGEFIDASISVEEAAANISLTTTGHCLKFDKDGKMTGFILCSEIAAVYKI